MKNKYVSTKFGSAYMKSTPKLFFFFWLQKKKIIPANTKTDTTPFENVYEQC
jgi:hypothetical protein